MCLFMATGHYRVFSLWTTWKTGMGHHSLGTRSLQNCLFLETRICQRMIMMVKWLGWSQSLLTRSGTWRHCRSRLHFSTTLIGLIVTKVSPLVLCRRGNTSKIRWMWSCFAKSGSIRLPCRKSRLWSSQRTMLTSWKGFVYKLIPERNWAPVSVMSAQLSTNNLMDFLCWRLYEIVIWEYIYYTHIFTYIYIYTYTLTCRKWLSIHILIHRFWHARLCWIQGSFALQKLWKQNRGICTRLLPTCEFVESSFNQWTWI